VSGGKWKSDFGAALSDLGFERISRIYVFTGRDAAILSATERGFGKQYHFSFGIWIFDLANNIAVPDRIEHTHMYFRLERLFPDAWETIVKAGETHDPKHLEALEDLCSLLRGDLGFRICDLATIGGLRRSIQSGLLDKGLVRWEARKYFIDG
jgi:hypothetical protein